MATIASLAVILALLLVLVGSIWLLIAGFQESVLWGLAMLFVPITQLFFVVVHWRRARDPFMLQVYGVIIMFIAAALGDARIPLVGRPI